MQWQPPRRTAIAPGRLDTAAFAELSREVSASTEPRWWTSKLPYLPALFATFLLAYATIAGILERTGHPAVPLDDAFIHFQYARRLAEGHFFSYADGEGFSSGATSLLWPILLAPFHALGLRDLSLIWAAWGLSYFFLAALSVETYRLASKLVGGSGTAIGAAAMVLGFGGYAFCASTGMEATLFAWALARTGRLACGWHEGDRRSRILYELIAFGLVAPFVRPEGALASLLVAGTLALAPPPHRFGRAIAVFPLLGPLLLPALLFAMTGSASSSTTQVKWLPANPYFREASALFLAIRGNIALLFATLLDGREWSALVLPQGSRPFALAALVALPLAGFVQKRAFRGCIVLALALGMLVPTTYDSFLWNRLRYLWPFAFAWFVGLACVAHLLEKAVPRRMAQVALGPLMMGLGTGLLAARLPWTLDDIAKSAAAIDAQQVTLGRFASASLPSDARIGVNDTGAIAYLGGRRTFDIVGLTTPSEAPHWVAGPGSRYEHYERLAKSEPEQLPTHLFVYPHWMALDAVLGEKLTEATVTDQSILGGTTMIAHEARWEVLGRADLPEKPTRGRLVDELDVADLVSEKEHAYRLFHATAAENVAVTVGEGEAMKVDGARLGRTREEFAAHLLPGVATTMVARLSSEEGARLVVSAGGVKLPIVELAAGEFVEVEIPLPGDAVQARTPIRIEAEGGATFGALHYWFFADEGGEPRPRG